MDRRSQERMHMQNLVPDFNMRLQAWISSHSSSCNMYFLSGFFLSFLHSIFSVVVFSLGQITDHPITLYPFLHVSYPLRPSSLFLSSLPSGRVGNCVGRHVAMWSRWRSRPMPQECGILIWAICNDRPPMSAEEWQVERL